MVWVSFGRMLFVILSGFESTAMTNPTDAAAVDGRESGPCTEPKRFKTDLVFIVGCQRSGTTLVASLLGRHPECAATPETHFWSLANRRNEAALRSGVASFIDSIRDSRCWRDLGIPKTKVVQRLQGNDQVSLALFFKTLLDVYREQEGKSICIEKTPDHMLFVPQLAEWFPTGHFIHMIRDGRDAAVSLNRVPWARLPLQRGCFRWKKYIRAGRKFARKHVHRWLDVHFQDLVRNPEETLRQINDFIGIQFSPSQLDTAVAVQTVPEWESAWKSTATQPMKTDRLGVFERECTPDQIAQMHSIIGGELRALGYASDWPREISRLRRLRYRLRFVRLLLFKALVSFGR